MEENVRKSIPEPPKYEGVDEKEVYALRAQALKSLAYKRASKAKQSKMVSFQFHYISGKTLLYFTGIQHS